MREGFKFFLLAVFSTGGQSADAYTCKPYDLMKDEYAASYDVVEARVVSITRNVPYYSPARKGEAGKADIDVSGADAIKLRIYKSYKHRVGGEITVTDPHGRVAFPMEPGSPYVLFLRSGASNGELLVDKCGSSFPLLARYTVPRLSALERLSQPSGHP